MYIIASVWSNYSNTIRGVKGKSDFLGYLWKKNPQSFPNSEINALLILSYGFDLKSK